MYIYHFCKKNRSGKCTGINNFMYPLTFGQTKVETEVTLINVYTFLFYVSTRETPVCPYVIENRTRFCYYKRVTLPLKQRREIVQLFVLKGVRTSSIGRTLSSFFTVGLCLFTVGSLKMIRTRSIYLYLHLINKGPQRHF